MTCLHCHESLLRIELGRKGFQESCNRPWYDYSPIDRVRVSSFVELNTLFPSEGMELSQATNIFAREMKGAEKLCIAQSPIAYLTIRDNT